MSRSDYGTGSIRERTPGRWQITVEAGRDPRSTKRRRTRFTVVGTRKDALRALREAQQQRDHGIAVSPEKITVAEWLNGWLERHRAEDHINARTHDRYRQIVRCHLVPGIGQLRLQQLRSDHIADLKAQWLSGKDSTSRAPLSGGSVHKHLVVLRRALADAVRAGIIVRNPMDAVSSPSIKGREERRALTEEEIANLVAAAAGTRFDAAIRFTLATGVREGELLGLKWQDVDWGSETVTIRRTVAYVDSKAVFGTPKTNNSRRAIELSAATSQLLHAHRAAQAAWRLRLGPIWRENGLIFPSMKGTPWLARDFYRDYRVIVQRSGIADPTSVTWHCLRHTAASQWLVHGADVFSVSRRLGHASASFTMDTYAHLLRGQQRQAAEALDHLLAQA